MTYEPTGASNIFVQPRHREYADTFDYFPTPGWATRAFFEHVRPADSIKGHVWECAAGEEHMSRVMRDEYGLNVTSTDIMHDNLDFLKRDPIPCDWVITNPPYKLATDFAIHANNIATTGVAFFIRYTFLETKKRYERLFAKYKPKTVAQFVERVPITYGKVSKSAGTAIAYTWIVWEKGYEGPTEFKWIPICKDALMRPEDFDD